MSESFYKDNMNIREINGFTAQLVAKNVWAIDEFGIDIMYLIIGTKKALLIDTGIGIGDINLVVKELTPLPLYVVNSHHHYDHVGGNGRFTKVYAHSKAVPTILEQNNITFRKDFFMSQESRSEYTHKASLRAYIEDIKSYEIQGISEGDSFDLGDRIIEVIFTPGHTKDSICLLDLQNKLLFSADTIVSTPTLILDTFSDTLSNYLNSLIKLKSYKNSYNLIFPGHYIRPIGQNYIDDMIICTQNILQNPTIGENAECNMAKAKVYYHQYGLASILYTLDRCI